jgi:hypothetical protein
VAASVPAESKASHQAADAWEKGAFDQAANLYREAITHGGMSKTALREAYLRMGAALAIQKKNNAASDAFRWALVLDPQCVPPAEAGKRVAQVFEAVKGEVSGRHPLGFSVDAPSRLAPSEALNLQINIRSEHSQFVEEIEVVAQDPSTGEEQKITVKSSSHGSVPVPSAGPRREGPWKLRILALDRHGNRLAEEDAQVTIANKPPQVTPPPIPTAMASSALRPTPPPTEKANAGNGSKIWRSPWPYLVGGLTVVAGGVAIIYASQPGEQVTIGSPRLISR